MNRVANVQISTSFCLFDDWGAYERLASLVFIRVLFFFQAEDGIRDIGVTGVQTCALPISNYGPTNVHLAAPGDQIYTTFGGVGTPNNLYYSDTGTSMSAPFVTGALALMFAKFSTETHQQIINRLLAATDPLPSLAGKCVSGGRLNLRNALSPPVRLTTISTPTNSAFQLRVARGPNRTCVVQMTTNLINWSSD